MTWARPWPSRAPVGSGSGSGIIEIINNTRDGIIIFFSENKRERGDWGQTLVSDAGPSAYWLS